MSKVSNKKEEVKDYAWLNPIGSLGDAIALSGILKKAYDEDHNRKYNLVRRSKYQSIFEGHPAVEIIGHPEKNAEIIDIDFWFKDELINGKTAYQKLAEILKYNGSIDGSFYIPEKINGEEDVLINNIIPWKEKNLIIAPSSYSPRKMVNPGIWHQLVNMLRNENIFVIQVGVESDLYIKQAYNLLGLTNVRQLINVIKKANGVLTVDNLIKHAAKAAGKPAVVIYGPTRAENYGYNDQVNIHGQIDHCELKNECLGFDFPQNYRKPCPLDRKEHCINKINIQEVFNSIINILNP
jgi:hypothetical protein